jgi:hypothetical protein
VSASFVHRRPKRKPDQIRRVQVRGKEYRDVQYTPQFALGIICRDEQDQQALHVRLRPITAGRDVKVLVI